jgi:hypothetical protein
VHIYLSNIGNAVHQLFIDSRMPVILLVGEVLYDILIDFDVTMKLVRLRKMW